MRILVTGATGFVGGHLVAQLAASHEIWALARLPRVTPGGSREGPSSVHWLAQDLANPAWTVKLPDKIDAVIHLAQSPHFRDFPDHAADIHGVSAGATMRLLDWAFKAGARRFILGSTGGLYGSSNAPLRETDPLPETRNQLGFYFAAKRASELLAMQYATQFSVVVLRFFFVYGAGQPAQMLMPRIMENIRAGHPVLLHGEEGIRINPIYVRDAVSAIARSLDLGESRIFNIAGPEIASLREIALQIGRTVGRVPVFNIDNTVPPSHLVADIRRMTSALWVPMTGIKAGIGGLCGVVEQA